MFDFIPLPNYIPIYLVVLSVFVIFVSLYSLKYSDVIISTRPSLKLAGVFFLLFFIFYIGLRPLSGQYFVDMITYAQIFDLIKNGAELDTLNIEVVFSFFMWLFTQFGSLDGFFLTTCALYILCIYFACKRWFSSHWVLPFCFIVMSAFFLAYGTNGIRNGLATSVFLLGLSHKHILRWALILLSMFIHSSLALPVAAAVLFLFNKNLKHYLAGWFICLALAISVSSLGQLLGSLDILNDKISDYANADASLAGMGKVGFRLDFLLYGSFPIIVGLYFIIKQKFYDPIYNEIICIYITANAFWLLVMRIPFSNRFAYLSWFMYGLVIAYPLMKNKNFRYQNRYAATLLILLYLFNLLFLY